MVYSKKSNYRKWTVAARVNDFNMEHVTICVPEEGTVEPSTTGDLVTSEKHFISK